ncbi:Rieske 2Fe-2S domain-containing protein [Pseudomaricurvus alkylphenolicus]|uniref:Rieske 2Fe-2S domain-containing protein n=1 Tax=Pseudomaricurvus alkylphenolicus TaxID=1306991 RepID=UPI001421805F|nr:Rieske 2Fe-2S domain-containing protein [Pseudomaricurvus alkylphenolicus]NIB38707.1 Rieske 2Fe-2S domain-containing protein [Pseudomaricurvus alkylphenolicus]
MLAEQNERLCRVGPGTPGGEMLRRYWIPACLSSDIAEPDCDPFRLRRLSENLVAFRDTEGRVGVLDERCPHRGVSLSLGRNEQCGLRCIYHGWKFDVEGNVVDSQNAKLEQIKTKAKAYPTIEKGGIIWIYMGPEDKQPKLPEYEWSNIAPEYRFNTSFPISTNWQGPLEGLFDPTHAAILHNDNVAELKDADGNTGDGSVMLSALQPELRIEYTDFGHHYGALRPASEEEGKYHCRTSSFVAPFSAFIAPGGACFMSVPVDDYNTMWFAVVYDPKEKRVHDSGPALEHIVKFLGADRERMHRYGLIPYANLDPDTAGPHNRWNQDRESMRNGTSHSGIDSLAAEDALLAVSSGPLWDRTHENLVPADLPIVRYRRVLFESIKRVENGEDPVGVDVDVDHSQIAGRSGIVDMENWRDINRQYKVREL